MDEEAQMIPGSSKYIYVQIPIMRFEMYQSIR